MKTLMSIFTILFITSCASPEPATETGPFSFVVEGTVANGEGKVLALLPAYGDPEERLTAKIVEGKYRFEGTSDYLMPGVLRFEEDILNFAGEYAVSTVIIEPGVTTLNLRIDEEGPRSLFAAVGVEQGDNNLNYLSFARDFNEARGDGGLVFGDSIRNDSMVKYGYPPARERVFGTFDRQFDSGHHGLNAILLEQMIISRIGGKGLFNRDQLTPEQKDKITGYFMSLDSTEVRPEQYALLRESVLHLHDDVQPRAFREMELFAVDGWKGKLSEKVGANKYSMLYFWFTECRPCREFNRRMKKEYATLQARGVEIVAINVDDSQAKWKKTTATDSIPWTNLYAGDNSGVEVKYNVTGYPTKLAYDRNLNFVNVKLKTMDEILDWTNGIK